MTIDPNQLSDELAASFTASIGFQALTVAVMYQQAAEALGFGADWAADRLDDLSATVAREAPKSRKRQFGEGYADMLRHYAEQLRNKPEDGGPRLTLIPGGKDA